MSEWRTHWRIPTWMRWEPPCRPPCACRISTRALSNDTTSPKWKSSKLITRPIHFHFVSLSSALDLTTCHPRWIVKEEQGAPAVACGDQSQWERASAHRDVGQLDSHQHRHQEVGRAREDTQPQVHAIHDDARRQLCHTQTQASEGKIRFFYS